MDEDTLDKLEKMRQFHIRSTEQQLVVVLEAMQKSHGYAVTDGKRNLRRLKQAESFWCDREKVIAWAIKKQWEPREDVEYV